MPSLRETMLQTGLSWLASPSFLQGRTSNAHHTILPASLGIRPQQNNSDMSEWLAVHLPGLRNYTSNLVGDIPVVIDEKQRLVVMHVTGLGNSDIGTYGDEYIWTLKTTSDGKEIEE